MNIMNKEKALEEKIKKPDLLCLSGSQLYGTSTPESDTDLRGFLVPPYEYLVGLSNFEQSVIREPEDKVVYSIKKFFELLMRGDPTATELLFVPKNKIVTSTYIGHTILANKNIFLSQKLIYRILGYSESEWRKVQGTQLVFEKRTPTEDQVIESIREIFKPSKDNMDEILRMLFENYPKKERKCTEKLGAKRKKQITDFGFCTSSASHTIRLLGQLHELLESQTITFPRPSAQMLLDIKMGLIKLNVIEALRNQLIGQIQELKSTTKLKEHVSLKEIMYFYNETIGYYLCRDDERFTSNYCYYPEECNAHRKSIKNSR